MIWLQFANWDDTKKSSRCSSRVNKQKISSVSCAGCPLPAVTALCLAGADLDLGTRSTGRPRTKLCGVFGDAQPVVSTREVLSLARDLASKQTPA